jgi:hypothetical protein
MEEENNNPKIKIDKESHIELLNFIAKQKLEDRELALDRYRKADEEMEDGEMMAMLGKTAISYLELASKSSNVLLEMARDIQKIVYKDDEEGPTGGFMLSEADRQFIASEKKEERSERRARRQNGKSED